MTTAIRNLNKKVFAEFKAEAVRDGLGVGEALNLAMLNWLAKKESEKLDFRNFKPTKWGKGTEKTSMEIDKILYGD